MTKMENILLLDGKVPIRRIQKPYCKKCMNPVEEDIDLCGQCSNPPLNGYEWYFNRIISIGNYKTYKNKPYNNIPKNIISRMILTLKGDVKKPKRAVGILLADGLNQITNIFPFLIEDLSYILIPPKNNKEEENQCKHFLSPFLKQLRSKGLKVKNLNNKVKRIKDIGKIKDYPTRELKFEAIKNAHEVSEKDLKGGKTLILDDIVTSRSTIWDISKALKEKNAGEINILSIGRTLFNDTEFFTSDMDFIELITYFSNLDNVLYPEKIEEVKISDYKNRENELSCSCGNYKIIIDYNNKTLSHECTDFKIRRYRNKSFCKHITKLFLIVNGLDEKIALDKLNEIYKNIRSWEYVIV